MLQRRCRLRLLLFGGWQPFDVETAKHDGTDKGSMLRQRRLRHHGQYESATNGWRPLSPAAAAAVVRMQTAAGPKPAGASTPHQSVAGAAAVNARSSCDHVVSVSHRNTILLLSASVGVSGASVQHHAGWGVPRNGITDIYIRNKKFQEKNARIFIYLKQTCTVSLKNTKRSCHL